MSRYDSEEDEEFAVNKQRSWMLQLNLDSNPDARLRRQSKKKMVFLITKSKNRNTLLENSPAKVSNRKSLLMRSHLAKG